MHRTVMKKGKQGDDLDGIRKQAAIIIVLSKTIKKAYYAFISILITIMYVSNASKISAICSGH